MGRKSTISYETKVSAIEAYENNVGSISMIAKMFNVKDNSNANANTRQIVTPNMQVNNLQKNINDAANFQKRNNINNIVKKWK